MKELNIEEIRDIELKLLSSFDTVCKRNGWRYSLGGGSLLGAVRHKGFIPWDDDIDIIMPRSDYDAFVKSSQKEDYGFDVMTHEITSSYNYLHGKIIAPNTILEDPYVDLSKLRLGINIDIFPIEGLGDSFKQAVKTFRKTSLRRELLNARSWKRFFRSKTHSIFFEPARFIMFLSSRFVKAESLLKSIDIENRKRDFDSVQYCGCVSGCYRVKEILPYRVFSEYCEMEFEGKEYKCLKYYDEYLKSIYGNYMKLPPKEKQITHHTFKAYIVQQ